MIRQRIHAGCNERGKPAIPTVEVRHGVAVIFVIVFFLFSFAAGQEAGLFEFVFLFLPVLLVPAGSFGFSHVRQGEWLSRDGFGRCSHGIAAGLASDPLTHLVGLTISPS
jgi:hypothetical protein